MKVYKTDRLGNLLINDRVTVSECYGETIHDISWYVAVDGIQHGGNRDPGGSGDLTFATEQDAIEYAESI